MSTLVNSGTISVVKLMVMGDASSTLSSDTARPVSRVSVRSPWKAWSNFEQHGHGAVVDQRDPHAGIALLSLPTPLFAYRRLLANSLGDRAVELAPPEIHTSRVATRHRGYAHTVFTFFADAADLIRPFIAEVAHAQTAPL
jgi:hypothetical protein